MDKIIFRITAAAILLLLLLVSRLWYRLSIPTAQDDILYLMRIPRSFESQLRFQTLTKTIPKKHIDSSVHIVYILIYTENVQMKCHEPERSAEK